MLTYSHKLFFFFCSTAGHPFTLGLEIFQLGQAQITAHCKSGIKSSFSRYFPCDSFPSSANVLMVERTVLSLFSLLFRLLLVEMFFPFILSSSHVIFGLTTTTNHLSFINNVPYQTSFVQKTFLFYSAVTSVSLLSHASIIFLYFGAASQLATVSVK